jgi:hypothetical protein
LQFKNSKLPKKVYRRLKIRRLRMMKSNTNRPRAKKRNLVGIILKNMRGHLEWEMQMIHPMNEKIIILNHI